MLKPGGRFIFAVPHPSLAFVGDKVAPFYFEPDGKGYFSGRDCQFEGKIWRRDGKSVPVRSVHKTLEDYMTGLEAAGFETMPKVTELRATEEHLAMDPEWFGPLRDLPLHLGNTPRLLHLSNQQLLTLLALPRQDRRQHRQRLSSACWRLQQRMLSFVQCLHNLRVHTQ